MTRNQKIVIVATISVLGGLLIGLFLKAIFN